MNKTLTTALAISLAFGVTAAEARQNGPMLPQFSEVDTDGNGQITEVELGAIAALKFNEADANSDGFLDADEMVARFEARMENKPEGRGDGEGPRGGQNQSNDTDRGERMKARMGDFSERMIERADTDDDGKLSLAEMTAARPDVPFERFDADESGTISEMEWHVAADHRGDNDRGRGHGRGNR